MIRYQARQHRGAMKIDGSAALVTGANRGLGRAYARELVKRGAAKVYGRHVTRPPSPSPA
jgi:NAD(P)-dependent dehydrogenase (short-subunit alcohol dehydrogenase family)